MEISSESFTRQFSDADRKLREDRARLAMEMDRRFGQDLERFFQGLDAARATMRDVAAVYNAQHRRTYLARVHVRRCRHGCAACPHSRFAFFRDGKQVEIPIEVVALRNAGIRRQASHFYHAQKSVIALEKEISTIYREIWRFWDRSLEILRTMDASLADLRYPDYPTPFVAPDPDKPFFPLPYRSIALFSTWLDNALLSLSFSMLRYAVEFARTKYGRAKQGFYGIHRKQRNQILLPLYFDWRLYFRGQQGIWFGARNVIYKPRLYQGLEGQKHPVKLNPRFVARSGNKPYFQDIRKYSKMYKKFCDYREKQERISYALLNFLGRQ
jgi:hypothetical protein